jgi:hypothetical protein
VAPVLKKAGKINEAVGQVPGLPNPKAAAIDHRVIEVPIEVPTEVRVPKAAAPEVMAPVGEVTVAKADAQASEVDGPSTAPSTSSSKS